MKETLRAILERDGPSRITHDRNLIGAIATASDYMVAGVFIPTDERQAVDALAHNTGLLLWRWRTQPDGQDHAMRDRIVVLAHRIELSVNQYFVEGLKRTMQGIWGEKLRAKLALARNPMPLAMQEMLLAPPIPCPVLDRIDMWMRTVRDGGDPFANG